jgi:hypothetical protein
VTNKIGHDFNSSHWPLFKFQAQLTIIKLKQKNNNVRTNTTQLTSFKENCSTLKSAPMSQFWYWQAFFFSSRKTASIRVNDDVEILGQPPTAKVSSVINLEDGMNEHMNAK